MGESRILGDQSGYGLATTFLQVMKTRLLTGQRLLLTILLGGLGLTKLHAQAQVGVGIGTATPYSRLSLGTAGSAGNSPLSRIANYEAADGTYFYGTGLARNATAFGLGLWGGTSTSRPWDGSGGALPHIFIESTGRVGIGTLTPDRPLTLQAPPDGSLLSLRNSSGSTLWHWAFSGGGLNLAETGVAAGRFFVAPGGNVGLGTTSPQARLHVAGGLRLDGLAGTGPRMLTTDASGNVGASTLPSDAQQLSISGSTISLTGGGSVTVPSSADNLGNHTATAAVRLNDNWLSNDGGAEGIRVANNGYVGVGTATPGNPLEVAAPENLYAPVASVTQNNTNATRVVLGPNQDVYQTITVPTAGNVTALLTYWTNQYSYFSGTMTISAPGLGSVTAPYTVPAGVSNYGLVIALPTWLYVPANTVITVYLNNTVGLQYFRGTGPGNDAYAGGGATVGIADNGYLDLRFALYSTGARATALTVSPQGGVGIGVTPSAALDVNGQVRIRGGVPGVGKYLVADADGLASWQTLTFPPGASAWTPNGNSLYVSSATKVGIGTTAPTNALHVDDANTYQVARFSSANTTGAGLTLAATAAGARAYSLLSTGSTAGPGAGTFGLFDEASGAYRYIVDGTGQFGINTTSPQRRFDCNGDGRFVGNLKVQGKLEVTDMVSYCNGPFSCSDRRYKKDITPLHDVLQNVLRLNGYSYFWRRDEFKDKGFTADKQLGFIAQELEQLYPEMVHTDPETGYKSVDYAKMTPVLLEALKELHAQLEATRRELGAARAEAAATAASVEARLRALEAGPAAQARR
jgi:hypothetical protein